MSTKVFYNGVDITNDITVLSCIMTDSNGGKQDYCKISFANGGKVWQEWKPQYNDEVRVTHGYSDSGIMYINGIGSNENTYTLILLPTPTTAKKKKSRIWRKVKLSEIISDAAKGIGFKVEFYGFKDYIYSTKTQINKTDIAFMCEACAYEGINVKIFNKTFIIYDEKTLNLSEAIGTIKPDECAFYSFDDENIPLSAVTVKYLDAATKQFISYTAISKDIDGGSITLPIKVDNQAQAERFAMNYLQKNNNYIECGTLKLKNADVFASGSVINLDEFNGYSGKWYINESIFDTTNNDCIFKINKIRGY